MDDIIDPFQDRIGIGRYSRGGAPHKFSSTNIFSHLFLLFMATNATLSFDFLPKCSVTPGSRGLAVNTRAPVAPALRMSDVADAVTAAEPEVMRPPINMPWESVSDQVRRRCGSASHSFDLRNGMLLRYPLQVAGGRFGVIVEIYSASTLAKANQINSHTNSPIPPCPPKCAAQEYLRIQR